MVDLEFCARFVDAQDRHARARADRLLAEVKAEQAMDEMVRLVRSVHSDPAKTDEEVFLAVSGEVRGVLDRSLDAVEA